VLSNSTQNSSGEHVLHLGFRKELGKIIVSMSGGLGSDRKM